MFRPRLFTVLAAIIASLVVTKPLPARGENPLESLHKKLFGDDDNKDKDKKKKKHHDDHRDDNRSSSYYHQPLVVERRVYVEPAPRPYYEPRREIYIEPAPRSYYGARPIEADVQLALRRNGYYYGPIDADLGPGTRAAIRDYQYDRRLPITGRIDTYLLRSLGL
jgi:hypothetical protein